MFCTFILGTSDSQVPSLTYLNVVGAL